MGTNRALANQKPGKERAIEVSWPVALVLQMPPIEFDYVATKCEKTPLMGDIDAGILFFAFVPFCCPFVNRTQGKVICQSTNVL